MLSARLIYDARASLPGAWWLPIVPAAFAVGGWWWKRSQSSARLRLIALFWLSGGSIGVLGSGAYTWGAHLFACYRLASGHVRRVEGVVFGFRPGDAGGHEPEVWSVRTPEGVAEYSYLAGQMGPGYSRVEAEGGAIHDGALVTISEVSGRIVRLEIH